MKISVAQIGFICLISFSLGSPRTLAEGVASGKHDTARQPVVHRGFRPAAPETKSAERAKQIFELKAKVKARVDAYPASAIPGWTCGGHCALHYLIDSNIVIGHAFIISGGSSRQEAYKGLHNLCDTLASSPGTYEVRNHDVRAAESQEKKGTTLTAADACEPDTPAVTTPVRSKTVISSHCVCEDSIATFQSLVLVETYSDSSRRKHSLGVYKHPAFNGLGLFEVSCPTALARNPACHK